MVTVLNPDKDLLKLVSKIVGQNGRILEINEELLKRLASPIIYVPTEEDLENIVCQKN